MENLRLNPTTTSKPIPMAPWSFDDVTRKNPEEIFHNGEEIVVTGGEHDGTRLLDLARQAPAQLVILDINLPEVDGLEYTRQLKKEFPSIKVLVLTMYHDHSHIHEMISKGADGCILKSTAAYELQQAIGRLHSKSIVDSLPELGKDQFGQLCTKLSAREIQIIQLIAKGKTSPEIAEGLFISEHTVRTHRKNIFRKLQIKHVSQLTTLAIHRGWA